jgi:hypothetical protein
LIAATGTIALMAALTVGGVIYLRRAPADSRTYRSSILLPAGVSFPPASVPAQRFTLSPDGRRLAFIAGEGGDVGRLWVQALDDLAPRPLPGTEDARFAFWSPDSRFIGFFADRKVKRIDAAGGPPLTLAEAAPAPSGAWSPDGTIVFASFGPGNPLRRVSASGGGSSPVTALDTDSGETQH